MLVRIKFVSDYSDKRWITKKQLDELQEFLGETISAEQYKIDEEGNPKSKNYSETFNEAELESHPSYTLVKPADAYKINDPQSYLVNLETFTNTFPNIEVTVRGITKALSGNTSDMLNLMTDISNKIEAAANRFDKSIEFNERCEVHVPNLGLLNINKVAYATDYCTEELQRLLKNGWRIIAVCPQPDQRRPDYILGMHVDSIDGAVEVEHFNGDGIEID